MPRSDSSWCYQLVAFFFPPNHAVIFLVFHVVSDFLFYPGYFYVFYCETLGPPLSSQQSSVQVHCEGS